MSKLFATGFERPVWRDGYPVTLAIAISEQVSQALYFERVYLNAAGATLAIRSTLISERGLLLLTETGPVPMGTTTIHASVTNQNRATEADPEMPVVEAVTQAVKFATPLDSPVMFGDTPVQLSLMVGAGSRLVYLERAYLDSNKQILGIRSDLVNERAQLLRFNIETDVLPVGTRYINVRLTNEHRDSEVPDGVYWTDSDGVFVSDFDNALIAE